jgi:hypothetical protein
VSHDHVSDRLGEHLEGDLSLAESMRVDRHLAECAACSSELRELRATVALLRGLPDPEPPERLRAAVMCRIEAGEGSRPLVLRLFGRIGEPRFAAALAAGCAALVVLSVLDFGAGIFLGTSSEPSPNPVAARRNSGVVTVADASGASQRLPGRSASAADGMRTALVAFDIAMPPKRAASEGFAASFGFFDASAPPVPLLDLDGEIERLMADPTPFLERMRRTAAPERRHMIAPLVEHSARRGDVALVARTLGMAAPPTAVTASQR